VAAAGTLWFQGYIYSEPVDQMYWRAPAVGVAVTLFLAFWVFLDYRAPGRYRELQEFSATESRDPFQTLQIINRDGKKEVYKRQKVANWSAEYFRNGRRGDQRLPSRPDKVIVIEGDKEYLFEPLASQRDAKGNYQIARGESLRYLNKETGWEMSETQMGQVYIFHGGWMMGNLLLNGLHLVVWFLCLWLLLQYQWPHAFGLALVCWVITTLVILPMVLKKAETVAQQRAAPAAIQQERGVPATSSWATTRPLLTVPTVDDRLTNRSKLPARRIDPCAGRVVERLSLASLRQPRVKFRRPHAACCAGIA
jgi:hypothetical protein